MVRRYCVFALMLLCVCLAVQPMSIAYATEGSEGGDFSYKVVYGPSTPTILGSTKQVQVYAPNNYEAALIVLGYQNDSRLTNDARALLSNQSTGGTYYDFAQGFSNNNDYWGNQLNFQDLGMNSALSMNNSMYGANNIWSSEYDQAMYVGSKQRVEAVLNGEITGGGGDTGGGGSAGEVPKTFTLNTVYYDPLLEDNQNAALIIPYNDAIQISVTLTDSTVQKLETYKDTYPYFFAYIQQYYYEPDHTSTRNANLFIGMSKDKYTFQNNVTVPIENYHTIQSVRISENFSTEVPNITSFYRYSDMNINVANNSGNFLKMYQGETTPTIPPTNWPENPTPTSPQPPEVPSPPNDPVLPQPPEPTDPTNPVYPTIVYEPDFVWQTADLSAILSAMDAHCRHLQAALHRECSNLWANLSVKIGTEFKTLRSFLHGQFDWLVDSIDEEFDDFELYLKTLFEWLADQLEFSFTGGGYDDNTVVSWLKKIYSKLGGGTNTRPVDPTVEPDNWWDWLTRLIADWIAGLTDMGLDELAGLLELLQELITKFPFSIPWDIAALLALLVSEPVTPEIRMPQMALTGSGLTQVGEYVVNLSDYNAVWEGVRFIEKVGFCIFLAWNTVHFMDLFKKGANTE